MSAVNAHGIWVEGYFLGNEGFCQCSMSFWWGSGQNTNYWAQAEIRCCCHEGAVQEYINRCCNTICTEFNRWPQVRWGQFDDQMLIHLKNWFSQSDVHQDKTISCQWHSTFIEVCCLIVLQPCVYYVYVYSAALYTTESTQEDRKNEFSGVKSWVSQCVIY